MANKNEYNENVNYVVDEMVDGTTDLDLYTFLTDFEKLDVGIPQTEPSGDYFLAQMSEYDLNYTLKQLGMIYEYYNIGKISKLKKADIIQAIVVFEHDVENCEIVMRRQQLWHYLEELKADKFMKRFVLSA
jgi:ABC-type molybdate transport system substrate-binding protein